jgi:hypothetical protein
VNIERGPRTFFLSRSLTWFLPPSILQLPSADTYKDSSLHVGGGVHVGGGGRWALGNGHPLLLLLFYC